MARRLWFQMRTSSAAPAERNLIQLEFKDIAVVMRHKEEHKDTIKP